MNKRPKGPRNIYMKKYRSTHREKLKAIDIAYRLNHKDELRAKGFAYRAKLRQEVINHYGGKCACPGCPETNPDFLTIDHVNGGGNKHINQLGGGSNFYRWLRNNNYPEGYQVLCYNCNMGRAKHKGICPHQMSKQGKKWSVYK